MPDHEDFTNRALTSADPTATRQETRGSRLVALRELQEWLGKNLSALPALFGLAGALAYGALNVASTIFYERLGVTPSDVGLGYGEALVRVAVIGAIVGATALVGVVLVGVAVHYVVGWPRLPRSRHRARLKLLFVGCAAICAYDVLLSVPPPLELRWSRADVFGFVVFGALVAIGVLVGLIFFDKPLAERSRLELRYGVTAGALWLLVAPLSFVAHAAEGASEVQNGHRQRASLLGAPFPWQVTVGALRWKAPVGRTPELPACVLYLGSSGDAVVVYAPSPTDPRSIRIPAADVIVEFHPDRVSCGGRNAPS